MGEVKSELVDVNCPFQKKDRHTQQLRTCNKLCVRVYPGSSGETFCTVCKLTFEFDVQPQVAVNTRVNVKPVK